MSRPANRVNRMGRTRAPFPPPSTEGQRLLQELTLAQGLTYTVIAHASGARAPSVAQGWLQGTSRPNDAMRAQLFGEYGIKPRAWNEAPTLGATGVVAPPVAKNEILTLAAGDFSPPAHTTQPPPPAPVAPSGPPPTTLAACLAVIERLELASQSPNLIASERIKLAESQGRMLALRARLESQAERQEDRIVREHPEWARLKRVIVRVMLKHPAALKDLTAALGDDTLDEDTTP